MHPVSCGSHGPLWTKRTLTGRAAAYLCAAIVGLASLGFYLATLAPGLTWAYDSGDGGELAAAARTWGIAHSPGYPSYLLAARAFTLLPVGEIATRTNLFSAVCAAGTSALITWTLVRAGKRPVSAISAGWALALSPLLWSQAIVTEVHALNGLFTALLLVPAALSKPEGQSPWPRVAVQALVVGGVWGLSLGNHPTAIFCAPLVYLALWPLGRRGLAGLIGILLGLAVYLYLPLCAASDPPINWGDPRTVERFWWTVSGTPYRQFVFALPFEHLWTRMLSWSGLLTQQFGWAGLMVAAWGIAARPKVDAPLLVATGTAMMLGTVFAVGYNTSDSYLYLIPTLVCLGLWLGTGLDQFLSALDKATHPRAYITRAGALLVLTLPLIAAVRRAPTLDLSADRAACDFADTVLERAPQAALLLSRRDAHTFALWYVQHALERRPDVSVVDLDLLGYDWYTARSSRQLALDVADLVAGGGEQDPQRWADVAVRPVCWIVGQREELACILPSADRTRDR